MALDQRGTSWTPATALTIPDYPALSIGAIAINPTNAQQIFVGTGESNCFSSMCMNDAGNILRGDGIFVSLDGGTTFTSVLNTPGQLQYQWVSRIAFSATASAYPTVFAATSNGLWRTNGGDPSVASSWGSGTPIFSNWQVTDVVVDPSHPNVVWAGLNATVSFAPSGALADSPVAFSADYGQTWTPANLNLPGGTYVKRTTLGVSQDGTSIYALMSDETGNNGNLLNGQVFRSTDSGASWQGEKASDPGMANDSNESQWNYESTIVVNPTNKANVAIGGVDLWVSSDSGITFHNVTNVYQKILGNPYNVHPDHHALTFIPSQNALYDGNDGGVWRWSNPCDSCSWSFTNLNSGGLNLTQFYGGAVGTVGNSAALWGGAQDNGESHYPVGSISCCGAAQWTESYGGDGGDTAVDYTNNANVFEEFVNNNQGYLEYSTDGGANWSDGMSGINTADPTSFIMPFVMSSTQPQTLYAGTNRVYKTTNGAASWTPLSSSSIDSNNAQAKMTALAVAPTNENVIYAGFDDGSVCEKSNSGGAWTCQAPSAANSGPPSEPITSLAVDPTSPQVAYATANGYNSGAQLNHVYETTSGTSGAQTSWKDISGDLPGAPAMSVLVNPNDQHQLFVGTDAGIYTTTDNGVTWAHFGTGFPDIEVSQLFTDHTGANLYVATLGRGMWTIPIAGQHAYMGTCGSSSTSSTLFSIDALSGVVSWLKSLNVCLDHPVLANGMLYFSNGDSNNSSANGVYAFNAGTGAGLWTHSFTASTSSPVIANGLVYVGAQNNYVSALDASTGALVWTSACLCKAKQTYGVTPVYGNGTLYVTDGAQYVYALDPSTGATLWTYSSKGGPQALTYANGMIYFASGVVSAGGTTTWYVDAVDISTHRLVWSFQVTDPLFGSGSPTTPTVANGVVYFGATNTVVYALNASTGAKIWAVGVDAPPGIVAVVNGVGYIGDNWIPSGTAEVEALNLSNGAVIWKCTSAVGVFGDPIALNGLLYASNGYDGIDALNISNGSYVWKSPGYPAGNGVPAGDSIAVG